MKPFALDGTRWLSPVDRDDPEVVKAALVDAWRRTVLYIASSPIFFALAVLVLWSDASNGHALLWMFASTGSAMITAAAARRLYVRLDELTIPQLKRSAFWILAVPVGAHWAIACAAIAPTDGATALLEAATISVFGMVCFALVASVHMASVAVRLAMVAVPNVIWLLYHGFVAAATVIACGALLAMGSGAATRRPHIDSHVLAVRNQRLLSSVRAERNALSKMNEELEFRANHDLLMGIPNRDLLKVELDRALALAQQEGRHVALFFLDLDRFKFVNDSLGHAAGDALLEAVGERIKSRIRGDDALVARVGGDELVVLYRHVDNEGALAPIGQRLAAVFSDPFVIDGTELSIGTSIGMVASGPDDTAGDLYRYADAALYEAKDNGRGRAVQADVVLRTRLESRVRSELSLRKALRDDRVEPWFQPEVELVSGEIVAGEALGRWSSERGLLSMTSCADVARRTGLNDQIALRLIDQLWTPRDEQETSIPIGINISVAGVEALVSQHANPTTRAPLKGLRLEISRTSMEGNLEQVVGALAEARSLGATVLLDNFGRGTSSIRMLTDLPIDGVKLDRSYVARITTDHRVRSLVTGIAEFGRSSHLEIIAEGVETARQAEFLLQVGIDRAQGPLFADPVARDDFFALVRGGQPTLELAGLF